MTDADGPCSRFVLKLSFLASFAVLCVFERLWCLFCASCKIDLCKVYQTSNGNAPP